MITTIPEQRIRIEKIKLQNFKGVSSGTVEFNCLRNPVEKEIQADLLGLYGQNGSGKTTLLEVLHVVKLAMMGKQIPCSKSGDIIAQGADFARAEVQFQVRNADDSIYHVEYAFSLGRVTISTEQQPIKKNKSVVSKWVPVITASAGVLAFLNPIATASMIGGAAIGTAAITRVADIVGTGVITSKLAKSTVEKFSKSDTTDSEEKLIVFNETLSLSGMFNGNMVRFGPIFDASSNDVAFLPKARHKSFFPNKTTATLKELQRYKGQILFDSRSFIFSDEITQILLTEQPLKVNGIMQYCY